MRPGKCALLPMLCGPGSVDAQHVRANLNGSLSCRLGDTVVHLNIVKNYKHMGVRSVASGSHMPEINARHATCASKMSHLRGDFFKRSSVAYSDKLNVA